MGSFLGFLWCIARVFVRTPSGRQRFNVLGALDAVTKKLEMVTNDSYITSIQVCELLKQIAANATLPVTLVLDNARYQRCKMVMSLAKDLGIELRNQVHRYLLSNGISEGVLTDWANGNVLDGSPLQALPLDEFSNSERLDLVRTCRQIVRDTEDRLALGDALLREGSDPRVQ